MFVFCIRFHWELTDVPIFLSRNFVIDLLGLQTILGYLVSHFWVNFLIHAYIHFFVSYPKDRVQFYCLLWIAHGNDKSNNALNMLKVKNDLFFV